jgi:hypothetical protein
MPEYIKNSAGLPVRQWSHKNTEQKMIADERARQARRNVEHYPVENPESPGSRRNRIDALIIAIQNLHYLDRQSTLPDSDWY